MASRTLGSRRTIPAIDEVNATAARVLDAQSPAAPKVRRQVETGAWDRFTARFKKKKPVDIDAVLGGQLNGSDKGDS